MTIAVRPIAATTLTQPQIAAPVAAWGALVLALAATPFLEPAITPYALAWCQLGILFLAVKSVVIASSDATRLEQLGPIRLLGFVFLWPGMRLEPFFEALERSRGGANLEIRATANGAIRKLVVMGLLNLIGGVLLLALLRWPPVAEHAYLAVAVGLAGVALVSLYGLFNWLTALWRSLGVDVSKQWLSLPDSPSLAEYWSQRWNRAFHDFARDHVFLPLKRRWGGATALAGSFLFSGALHDAIISVPARGGYGLPTLYFLIQGFGVWGERRWLGRGRFRRAWAAAFVLAPLGLLLHAPFVTRVVAPQFVALGLLKP